MSIRRYLGWAAARPPRVGAARGPTPHRRRRAFASFSAGALLLFLGCTSVLCGSEAWAEGSTAPALDEVLVTGERPGPGMWRVSKGDHALWILATLEPLPKGMVWRSRAVEERIAASDTVLTPPQVDTDIGFFRGLTLVPAVLRARKNPDGQTLEQTLPHDLYMRWLALRVKYLGHGDGDEKLRPMVAAYDIYTHALDAAGLTSDDAVWKVVEKTAHEHKVKVTPVTVTLHIVDPKAAIGELGQIPRDGELKCLETTIERIETDLGPMRQRANLWSLGDIDGLRALNYPNEAIACLNAVDEVPALRDQFERATAQLRSAWLAAADSALERNRSTFAVVPISEFLKADGLLAQLRSRGYTIDEPH
jgi:hypothetical protein